MDENMNNFIKCCLDLGKELLDKEILTEKEENFLNGLDSIVEKYLN